MDFRTDIIDVTRRYYETKIERHRINAEIILNHAVSTGNSGDTTKSFENEIHQMAACELKLMTLKRYFK